MNYIEKARKQRKIIENTVSSLSDQNASEVPEFFPKLKYDGSLIKAGTRINWNGTVKRAAVDLWDVELNNPDNAPALWTNLNYKDGIRFISEVITVTTAFAKGERGWWKDELYESLIDANIYTPETYPQGWLKVR